jgi:hypothetical protein
MGHQEARILLKDMSDSKIMELPIKRMVFLRLSAQTYLKLANLLGPLIMSTKALSSRSCELASLDELEVDLEDRDPEFVKYARKYIINLKKIDTIVPFPRCWVPNGHELIGFITSLDGGKIGYGTSVHSLAGKEDQENQENQVCLRKTCR